MNKKGEILKQIKSKLEKASKAHAGQAKAIGKVLSPEKKMIGGLLTKGIKAAYKAYRKSGGKKTSDLTPTQPGLKKNKRKFAKEDLKAALRSSKFVSRREKLKLR